MNLFQYFNEQFENELKAGDQTQEQIFKTLSEKFSARHGFDPFPSFDSFRKQRERKIRNGQMTINTTK